jgi:hypothetical protein
MINSVPDFEVLFLEGAYRNILEEGGYEKGIRDVERDVEGRSGDSTDNGMGRDASSSEGAGIDGDTFQSHLKTAAERIEKVRKRRAGKTERTDNWWADRKRYAERLAYGKTKERSASPYRRGDNRGRWRVAGLNVVATQYKPTIEFETNQGCWNHYAEGEYGYVHDWEKEIAGSAILDRGSFRGRPDIQERVRVWRDVFEQLLKEYSGDSLRDKERAYVDRGTIRGSTNEVHEGESRSQNGIAPPQAQYPFKVEPDGNVRLFHWSSTPTD